MLFTHLSLLFFGIFFTWVPYAVRGETTRGRGVTTTTTRWVRGPRAFHVSQETEDDDVFKKAAEEAGGVAGGGNACNGVTDPEETCANVLAFCASTEQFQRQCPVTCDTCNKGINAPVTVSGALFEHSHQRARAVKMHREATRTDCFSLFLSVFSPPFSSFFSSSPRSLFPSSLPSHLLGHAAAGCRFI